MRVLTLLLASIASLSLAGCANIVAVLQYPFYSHQLVHHRLLRELARRGHNLTVFASHTFDYGDVAARVTQHLFAESARINERHTSMLDYKQQRLGWLEIVRRERAAYAEITRHELAHPAVQRLLRGEPKFDLMIAECVYCGLLYLAEIHDCPLVTVSAHDPNSVVHTIAGNDVNPALYPEPLLLPFQQRHLSLGERVVSLFMSLAVAVLRHEFVRVGEEVWQGRGPRINAEEVGRRRNALLITNTNAAFGHVRPLMPNTIQAGFMHVEPPQPIEDRQLLGFLDAATHGAIVMSLGAKADTRRLRRATAEKFVRVFNASGLSVVWKFHRDNQTAPRNVLLSEWLPLADVLAHPNVKLLITHSGLLTAYEAIDREIPMIVFPLAYDHGSNARMLVRNGVAMELDLNDFEERHLAEAIAEMTKAKYKNNVRQLKRRVYDQPLTSRELAVWHIERVLRNKDDVLSGGYEEQIQRYYVDVLAIVLTSVCALVMVKKAVQKLIRTCKVKVD